MKIERTVDPRMNAAWRALLAIGSLGALPLLLWLLPYVLALCFFLSIPTVIYLIFGPAYAVLSIMGFVAYRVVLLVDHAVRGRRV